MAEIRYQESIGDLVKGIVADVRELVREEIALARVELREQTTRAKLAVASLGAAVGALVFAATFLLIAIATAVADLLEWPVWAGFLVVAVLLGVAGMVMLSAGRKRLASVRPVPEQTVETLKENSEWIAKRLSSANK
jgi:uncharacterized membrane protein YqjE